MISSKFYSLLKIIFRLVLLIIKIFFSEDCYFLTEDQNDTILYSKDMQEKTTISTIVK
jgi:hypothetical protein